MLTYNAPSIHVPLGGGGWNAIRYQILDPLKKYQISDPPIKKSNFQIFDPKKIKYQLFDPTKIKCQISHPLKKSNTRYQGTPVHPPPTISSILMSIQTYMYPNPKPLLCQLHKHSHTENTNYCFRVVDIGSYGISSDGGRSLEEDILNIPRDRQLPPTTEPIPFAMVADEAFPLKRYIMRPYPGRG